MPRENEPWGGDVHVPRWLRRLLGRGPDPEDSPEKRSESRRPGDPVSVFENANRASTGPMVDLYREGRQVRRRGTTGRRGD